MISFARGAGLVLLGFVLLVVESTVSTVIAPGPFAPNLILPIVIFLGVAPDVSVVRGVVVSFVLGYLLDLLTGNPMSLETFVLVATFLVSRGAGLRLFLRGPAFQVGLTFLATLVAGGASSALRAVFENPPPFPVHTPLESAARLVGPAVATAVMAPIVFALALRVDGASTARRDDAGAAA
ncbi:MAG: hypothetical protein H5U40_17275 [Polyangiaceae bacterium]|nr:hypothetical protein [Polyangiaceae bacterium]